MTDLSPSGYAINAILDRIDLMVREIPGVISSEDPECLHRMRVATRRLRSALSLLGDEAGLAGSRDFFKLVRSVTRRLGEARDLDVQVIWLREFEKVCEQNELHGVQRLILRLSQAREKKQPGIVRLLSGLSWGSVLSETRRRLQNARFAIEMRGGLAAGGDVERATRVIGLQIESVSQHSASLSSPDACDAQHRMRIEAKRLRYAMEIYRGLYAEADALGHYIDAMKKLQGLLGDLHDADVWLAITPDLMERERNLTARYFGTPKPFIRLADGYSAVIRDRAAFRASQYKAAAEYWDRTAKENTWGDLRALLLSLYRDGVHGDEK
jgi:CHAD domain-containing protein